MFKVSIIFFVLTILGTNAWAGPVPMPAPYEQEQQQEHQQEQQHCPGSCESPQPQLYTCHAKMVDCNGYTLYTFWGRAPNYQEACGYAVERCVRDASLGYGGASARCYALGK